MSEAMSNFVVLKNNWMEATHKSTKLMIHFKLHDFILKIRNYSVEICHDPVKEWKLKW